MFNLYYDDSNTPAFPWVVEILIPGISGRMSYKTKREAQKSLIPYLWTIFKPYMGILSDDDLSCIASSQTDGGEYIGYILNVYQQCEDGMYAF